MNLDRKAIAFAGIVILVSLTLVQPHSQYWPILTAVVGLDLIQACFSFRLAIAFKRPGVRADQPFSKKPRRWTAIIDLDHLERATYRCRKAEASTQLERHER
jgi:hypothetical protein